MILSKFISDRGVGIKEANFIKSCQSTEKCLLDNQIEQVWGSIAICLHYISYVCIYRTGVNDICNCEFRKPSNTPVSTEDWIGIRKKINCVQCYRKNDSSSYDEPFIDK